MNWRWVCVVWLAMAAAAAAASSEEEAEELVPALDADDDELALHQEESRNVHPRAYQQSAYNALPSGFRPGAGASLAELAGYTRPHAAQQQQQQHQQQHAQQQQHQPVRHQKVQQQERPVRLQAEEELEEEEEREEPDRLASLLQQSRFDCAGKQSGYYADQELQCEVFHYCQDNVKHSWICPDGFTFHQVHLICMPPTQDNICQKSAKYHFVNEYLYRPVNEEEVQRKPSLALKYSDRYYPAEVYHDDRYDDDEDDRQEAAHAPSPAPARLTAAGGGGGGGGGAGGAQAQVFRSAEEVNIPLGQRRPNRPYDFRF